MYANEIVNIKTPFNHKDRKNSVGGEAFAISGIYTFIPEPANASPLLFKNPGNSVVAFFSNIKTNKENV
ncbi:MAG: hypothetical protein CV087_04295 [Candidatus Brocadia sp. WS118]|nr:MAG: hypothetical protein CV087_04295 [Candidatus Brocadia sp. WS118]